jgi:hypothetical protein
MIKEDLPGESKHLSRKATQEQRWARFPAPVEATLAVNQVTKTIEPPHDGAIISFHIRGILRSVAAMENDGVAERHSWHWSGSATGKKHRRERAWTLVLARSKALSMGLSKRALLVSRSSFFDR